MKVSVGAINNVKIVEVSNLSETLKNYKRIYSSFILPTWMEQIIGKWIMLIKEY